MNAEGLFNGTLQERVVTLGQTIRGARLGFHWCAILQAMIRIAPEGDHFNVTMCPPHLIPCGKDKSSPTHFCWWDEPDLPGRSEEIVRNANPVGITRFSIDDQGKRI